MPAALCAQQIDTVSFVPVKTGYYDKISTKSVAKFSQEKSSSAFGNVTVNSSTLSLITQTLTFGKPVYVRDNVFVQGSGTGESMTVSGNMMVQGDVYANGVIASNQLPNVTKVTARNLDMQNRNVLLTTSSNLVIDGIKVAPPSVCPDGTEWKSVKAKASETDSLALYNVLACKGSSSASCDASSVDISACNNSCTNPSLCYWDSTNCCCHSTKVVLFAGDSVMCSSSAAICNGSTITSAAAVCNTYASDSAQCVCARGNLKRCVALVYGGSSDEAGCVQSGEYHEACTCAAFNNFTGGDYVNYACTGMPAQCGGGSSPTNYDCCCGSGTEIQNTLGDCSAYNYTPRLQGCFCRN